MERTGVARVTVALDPADVELLDRLAALEGSNRSAVLRSLLEQVRPILGQTVHAFEAAVAARATLDDAAAAASLTELDLIRTDLDEIHRRTIGAVSKLEGAAASDPRRSNHGGQVSNPTPPRDDS